jgi:hypothetical protein
MSTNNRTRKPKRKTGKLKMLLLTSSFLATLAGTQLLNINDALQGQTAVAAAIQTPIVEPAALNNDVALPANSQNTQITRAQIPQAAQLQIRPVARSRSSK